MNSIPCGCRVKGGVIKVTFGNYLGLFSYGTTFLVTNIDRGVKRGWRFY